MKENDKSLSEQNKIKTKLNMELEKDFWEIACNAAYRVEFITDGRELNLYTNAIYSAMMWGWAECIEKKEVLEEKNLITYK